MEKSSHDLHSPLEVTIELEEFKTLEVFNSTYMDILQTRIKSLVSQVQVVISHINSANIGEGFR